MKYEVIGWTDCGNGIYPPHDPITASVDAAIIAEIRKKQYLFGGDAHESYCPVLNDGTYVCYSWRGWGGIIAQAYEVDGTCSYMCGYMNSLIKPKARKYPERKVPDDIKIVPKDSLTETFVMHLSDEMFDAVKAGTKTVEVRLFDAKRKKVDVGDFIEFRKRSDENARVLRKVTDFPEIQDSFENMFKIRAYPHGKGDEEEILRFSPASLGAPKDSTIASLTEGMYRYYTKEDEKKYGVIAFLLEEPKHTCSVNFKVLLEGEDCLAIYSQKLLEAKSEEDFRKATNEAFDRDLVLEALSKVANGFQGRWDYFYYGKNDCYDADVNVMIRKTLQGLFGKEDRLKEIQTKYCASMELEVFSLSVKDSDQPKQIWSLDKDIVAFLHKADVRLNFGYKVV